VCDWKILSLAHGCVDDAANLGIGFVSMSCRILW